MSPGCLPNMHTPPTHSLTHTRDTTLSTPGDASTPCSPGAHTRDTPGCLPTADSCTAAPRHRSKAHTHTLFVPVSCTHAHAMPHLLLLYHPDLHLLHQLYCLGTAAGWL